jgi:hypothetical protein
MGTSVNSGVGPFRRLVFAFMGFLAGYSALLVFFLQNAVRLWNALVKAHVGAPSAVFAQTGDSLLLYAIFSFAGWLIVGVPIALAVPARLLSRVAWPLCLLIGAALGPLALLVIFVLLAGRSGQLSTFSLARTDAFWPLSILVSTVAFMVYTALLRRRPASSA